MSVKPNFKIYFDILVTIASHMPKKIEFADQISTLTTLRTCHYRRSQLSPEYAGCACVQNSGSKHLNTYVWFKNSLIYSNPFNSTPQVFL